MANNPMSYTKDDFVKALGNVVRNQEYPILQYAFESSNGYAFKCISDIFNTLSDREKGNILFIMASDSQERSYFGFDLRAEALLLGAIFERGEKAELVSFIADEKNPSDLLIAAKSMFAKWNVPGYKSDGETLPPAFEPPKGYQNHPDAKVIFGYLAHLRDNNAPELKRWIPTLENIAVLKADVQKKRTDGKPVLGI